MLPVLVECEEIVHHLRHAEVRYRLWVKLNESLEWLTKGFLLLQKMELLRLEEQGLRRQQKWLEEQEPLRKALER